MMENYHALLRAAMNSPIEEYNERTKQHCRLLVGHALSYDLALGHPALTTRQIPFKNTVGELIGFFRGVDSAADFRALGCHFWDKNANVSPDWLNNPYRGGRTDYLGRIYGKQWTDWRDRRIARSAVERDVLLARGYEQTLYDATQGAWLLERGINQLERVVHTIMTDPSSRRIILTGWRPDELDMMALPPCHMDYRFVPVTKTKTLHVVMTIRSWDLFLGAPANIISTSIMLETVARMTGYRAGQVVIQSTNAHIYEAHYDQVNTLLQRSHFPPPTLKLSDNIKQVMSVDEIEGAFLRIDPSDYSLEGYQSHPKISAEMSA